MIRFCQAQFRCKIWICFRRAHHQNHTLIGPWVVLPVSLIFQNIESINLNVRTISVVKLQLLPSFEPKW